MSLHWRGTVQSSISKGGSNLPNINEHWPDVSEDTTSIGRQHNGSGEFIDCFVDINAF